MQVTGNFRQIHPTAQSIEEGSTGLNAADQEAADRREQYRNEYIRERDDVLVNNLPPGRLKALEKHIALMHQLDDALIGKPSRFSEFDPELKNAIEQKNTYGGLLQAETDFYRRSWKTQAWNLVAGGNGFLLCFGVGTVLSNALGMPWLALVISPVVWSITERLIPMMRATSWRNKHADVDYPHIMRVSAQKIRDQVRQMFNLNAKKYMVNGIFLRKKLLIGFIFCISLFVSGQTLAHELIPRALQEYVAENPNATPEQIQQFSQSQSPEFAAKFKNGEAILNVIRKRNTSLIDNSIDFFKL